MGKSKFNKPIYSKSVSFGVTCGKRQGREREYRIQSESWNKDEVFIFAHAQYIQIPRKDIPLFIDALTNFVNLK